LEAAGVELSGLVGTGGPVRGAVAFVSVLVALASDRWRMGRYHPDQAMTQTAVRGLLGPDAAENEKGTT